MAQQKNRPKVYRSQKFITDKVSAVFPHLDEPDQYGNFSVDVDVLNNPEFKEVLKAQAERTLREGQAKLQSERKPTNDLFRTGEYKDEPYERISFKQKQARTVKGKQIKWAPRVVDAKRQPVHTPVWGGSGVKVAYYFQYTLTPQGCFLSPKLEAVQVIDLVGPGGEAAIDSLFGEEDGFVEAPTTDEPDFGGEDAGEVETNGPGNDQANDPRNF